MEGVLGKSNGIAVMVMTDELMIVQIVLLRASQVQVYRNARFWSFDVLNVNT